MKRIGLVGGLAAPHGRAFASLFNERDEEKWAALRAFTPKGAPIPGARVTLVWDEDRSQAETLAGAIRGAEVADSKEAMLGRIDGAVVVDDMSQAHARHALPFLQAGLPTFIDKPLSRDPEEAARLIEAAERGAAPLFSSSALRFARELEEARETIAGLGALKAGYASAPNELIYYGIHALELAVAAVGPGIRSVRNAGDEAHSLVRVCWQNGFTLALQVVDGARCPFMLRLFGEKGSLDLQVTDGEAFYRRQMEAFARMVETGKAPFPPSETLEILRTLALGDLSGRRGGEELSLSAQGAG